MWWNDISDIKTRLENLEETIESVAHMINDVSQHLERLNLTDKFSKILDDLNASVSKMSLTQDKSEDYLKNVQTLNTMINEFKGCVAMARGALKAPPESINCCDGQ